MASSSQPAQPAASSSRQRTSKSASASHDRYYGYRETAEFCEFVVSSLFPVAKSDGKDKERERTNNDAAASEYPRRPGVDTPPTSPPTKSSKTDEAKSPIPLGEFVAYSLYRTRLSQPITYIALVLLTRLKALYPSARGTPTSPHRLFLSSLMLASKITMDDTYSNKSWAIVGSDLWDVKEVNQMERELFAFLGWNVVVQPEELEEWERVWGQQWTQRRRRRRAEREAKERESRERERERQSRAEAAARALLAQSTKAALSAGTPMGGTTGESEESDEVEQLAPASSSSSTRPRTTSRTYRSTSSDRDACTTSPESSSSAPSDSPSTTSTTPYSHTSSYPHSTHSARRPSASSSRGPDSEYYESDAETDYSVSTGISGSSAPRPRWARPRGRDTPATPITPAEDGLRTPEDAVVKMEEDDGVGGAVDEEMRPVEEGAKGQGKHGHGLGAASRWLGNVVRGWEGHHAHHHGHHHHSSQHHHVDSTAH